MMLSRRGAQDRSSCSAELKKQVLPRLCRPTTPLVVAAALMLGAATSAGPCSSKSQARQHELLTSSGMGDLV
jgi:hypothetical protein